MSFDPDVSPSFTSQGDPEKKVDANEDDLGWDEARYIVGSPPPPPYESATGPSTASGRVSVPKDENDIVVSESGLDCLVSIIKP